VLYSIYRLTWQLVLYSIYRLT